MGALCVIIPIDPNYCAMYLLHWNQFRTAFHTEFKHLKKVHFDVALPLS